MSLINANRQKQHVASIAFNTSGADSYGNDPLMTGDYAPQFIINKNQVIISGHLSKILISNSTVTLKDILQNHQPLVILFYNTADDVIPNIKALASLNKDVYIMGGRVIVLTSTAYFKNFQLPEIDIAILYDNDNRIAEQFGLFNTEKPLWQWVSGIDNEFPLPAAFVIEAGGKIILGQVDYSCEIFSNDNLKDAFIRAVLTAVYHNK